MGETCSNCKQYRPIAPSPLTTATKLVVWGEKPGPQEATYCRPFVGPSGKILRKALRWTGMKVWSAWPNDTGTRFLTPVQEDVCFSNAILSWPGYIEYDGYDVARGCLTQCQAGLLKSTQPWLALGANAIEALTGYRFPKVLDVRGSVLPALDGKRWLTASLHPAFIARGGKKGAEEDEETKAQEDWFPLLVVDIKRALRNHVPHVITKTESLETLNGAKRIAIDIEGGYGKPISLVGFSARSGTAVVLPWSDHTASVLRNVLADRSVQTIYHNAAYDIPALVEMGLPCPDSWIDTINLAALVNPSVRLGLEAQALTHLPGSVAWKGLIDHRLGWEGSTTTTELYHRLHSEVLRRLRLPIPSHPREWFGHYNAQDVGYTFDLATKLGGELISQTRLAAYTEVIQPLQKPLLEWGQRGMLLDLRRMEYHRTGCVRL